MLDTGVAYPTKKPKFRRSPDFSRKQFLPGYDFVDKDRMPLDEDGHGTHVTGTIAERTGNHVGLTGLASRAKIIPVRVLDSEGFGTARNIAKGIRWAANHKAQVINMSFEFSLGRRTAAARSRESARRSSTPSRRARSWWPRPGTRTASRSPSRPAPPM